MKIRLIDYFDVIQNEAYVVIKPSPDLPNYQVGSDIDIFCYFPTKMAELTCGFLNDNLEEGYTVALAETDEKIHIDLLYGKEMHFRFDLYKRLPIFKEITLKPAFYASVIESAKLTSIGDEHKIDVKVPNSIDDFILRYVEYHEHFLSRPDKIKHIDYINEKISMTDKSKALEKLNYYTAFNPPIYQSKTYSEKLGENWQYYTDLYAKAKHLYKTAGVKQVISKVMKKVGLK
jgi:hypothetical protein